MGWGDRIPAELFKILKDDVFKVLHSICLQIWKTAVAIGLKGSVFIPIPKKGNAKKCSNYCTIVFVSHASKVILTILQASLQQYMNWELPDVQAGFRKGRGTRDQIANNHWIMKKSKGIPNTNRPTKINTKNPIYFSFTEFTKYFDSVDHNKLWKIPQMRDESTTLLASWETQTGLELGKEYAKAIDCHLLI